MKSNLVLTAGKQSDPVILEPAYYGNNYYCCYEEEEYPLKQLYLQN